MDGQRYVIMDNSGETQQPQVEAVPHTQQYITITPQQQPEVSQPSSTRSAKCIEKSLKTVRGLIFQWVIGVTILVLYAISTALYYHSTVIDYLGRQKSYSLLRDGGWVHHTTSLSVGILMILAASLGLAGAKHQKIGLIKVHLAINMILMLVVSLFIYLICASILEISLCSRKRVPPRCNKAWLAIDSIVLVSAVFGWIIALTLLVYYGTDICYICCSCCNAPSDINTVTEGAHPQAYTNPGFTSLKAVPMIRPSDVQPLCTYQPTLSNTEMGTQEPDPDVDKPAGTPVIISQSTTSTTGTSGTSGTAVNAQPGGAAADGGVWSLS